MPVVAICWLKLKVTLTFVVHVDCTRCPSSMLFYHYIVRCIQFVCSKMGYVKISLCVIKYGMLISSCREKVIKL
ncbi:hypothetical protein GLYMA_17G028950v4 [Glycine max]|nr:hypothetical protein GLYMA_17G028950v4 [Glycine max]KAH1116469.1 hypothetical protein GYH30_046066 [Glycine max]